MSVSSLLLPPKPPGSTAKKWYNIIRNAEVARLKELKKKNMHGYSFAMLPELQEKAVMESISTIREFQELHIEHVRRAMKRYRRTHRRLIHWIKYFEVLITDNCYIQCKHYIHASSKFSRLTQGSQHLHGSTTLARVVLATDNSECPTVLTKADEYFTTLERFLVVAAKKMTRFREKIHGTALIDALKEKCENASENLPWIDMAPIVTLSNDGEADRWNSFCEGHRGEVNTEKNEAEIQTQNEYNDKSDENKKDENNKAREKGKKRRGKGKKATT